MDLPRAPELNEYADPPTALRVAGGLWITDGVFAVLSGAALFAHPFRPGFLVEVALPFVLVWAGAYLCHRGFWLRRGAEARTGLLVVGLFSCVVVWPALLVASAVVLQTRPDVDHWFARQRSGTA